MVKIQVLGHGMIPGIGTVAPHKSPFEADYKLITRIMNHGSLQVNIQNPITKSFIPLTASNAKRMYETWNNYKAKEAPKVATPVLHPTAPQPVVEEKVEETKVEEKAETKKEYNNNYNNQKNNKHNNNNSFKPVVNPENK